MTMIKEELPPARAWMIVLLIAGVIVTAILLGLGAVVLSPEAI